MTGDSGFPKDETSTGCDRAPRKRPVAEEQDAMSNSTQDVVAHLLPAVVAVVVFSGRGSGCPLHDGGDWLCFVAGLDFASAPHHRRRCTCRHGHPALHLRGKNVR